MIELMKKNIEVDVDMGLFIFIAPNPYVSEKPKVLIICQ